MSKDVPESWHWCLFQQSARISHPRVLPGAIIVSALLPWCVRPLNHGFLWQLFINSVTLNLLTSLIFNILIYMVRTPQGTEETLNTGTLEKFTGKLLHMEKRKTKTL